MDWTLALGVLKEGLTLWNNREATKYLEKVMKLEKEWHEEMAKHPDDRSDLKIDSIMLELTILAQSFVRLPGKSGK